MKRLVGAWGRLLMLVLGVALTASAQIKIGDDVEMKGGGLLTVGYNGAYGDDVQSNHGLQFGFGGGFNGYYYNPNFLNFDINPYYNQSHANSSFESLSNSSGVNADVNFFTGSRFPGSVNYRYDYNSTGNLGLVGVPNFTTKGTGQGFAINWSALLPNWPTLSVGYSDGSGNGNLYGTNQTTQASNKTLNLRSSYVWDGFNLSGFYDHLSQQSTYPAFLSGSASSSDTHGSDFGFNGQHALPWNGQFYANFSRSSFMTDYRDGSTSLANTSDYTTDLETAGVNFHPLDKLSIFSSESIISNLSGYLTQNIVNNGSIIQPINLGSNSRSYSVGGGASYQFTQNLSGTAQAFYYDQQYFGTNFVGTYVSGTVNYNKRLWDTFTFSAAVVESANGQGSSGVGFLGTVNAYHRFGRWEASGSFSYAQNVQSLLITYTTSYYNYNANLHRRFSNRVQWTAAFNGSHSGLSNQPGTVNHAESYTTSLAYKWMAANANYSNSNGNSLLTNGGLVPLPPLPGEANNNFVTFAGNSYGGGVSITPVSRLSLSGTFSRSLNHTLANTIASRNSIELFDAQLRYHFRRVGFQAGYTRFTQGVSATGAPPGSVTSYYGGISRWFDFF